MLMPYSLLIDLNLSPVHLTLCLWSNLSQTQPYGRAGQIRNVPLSLRFTLFAVVLLVIISLASLAVGNERGVSIV